MSRKSHFAGTGHFEPSLTTARLGHQKLLAPSRAQGREIIEAEIRHALAHDREIAITTIGRRSGQPRRTEMWFHNLDGQIYLTGTPYRRDWYANLLANPSFTFHLRQSVVADLSARATPVTDAGRRRALMSRMLVTLGHEQEVLETWVAESPLVSVTFEES